VLAESISKDIRHSPMLLESFESSSLVPRDSLTPISATSTIVGGALSIPTGRYDIRSRYQRMTHWRGSENSARHNKCMVAEDTVTETSK
jgi:hypothetical protein